VNRLAVVPPLLGVPPLSARVSELPLQWQGRGLGRVRVVAVHVRVAEILAGLLSLLNRLVGCGLANGGRSIGARKGGSDAGNGHLARDGCALRKAQCSEGGGHGDVCRTWSGELEVAVLTGSTLAMVVVESQWSSVTEHSKR
jgi:hypothetical protein